MISPEIYIGLFPTKEALQKDLQKLIAENGGRLRLAGKLEAEMVRGAKIHDIVYDDPRYFTAYELRYIIENHNKVSRKEMAKQLSRSYESICQKICTLRRYGVLPKQPEISPLDGRFRYNRK